MSQKKYVIDDQNMDELKVIMRSIFLQYSNFQFQDIQGQVSELNDRAVDYASQQILGEISGYLNYKRDASSIHTLMERPTYLSNDNTLELKHFF